MKYEFLGFVLEDLRTLGLRLLAHNCETHRYCTITLRNGEMYVSTTGTVLDIIGVERFTYELETCTEVINHFNQILEKIK